MEDRFIIYVTMEYNTSGEYVKTVDIVNSDRLTRNGTNESLSDINEDDNIAVARKYFLTGLILNILWTVLIIVLNTSVIVIIYRYNKRSRLYFFLFHLALADLLTGLIHCVPHSIERIIGYDNLVGAWLGGDLLCKLQWTLGHVSVMTSNYILAFMSVDRAFAVCKPMKNIHMKGFLVQKVTIVCCWTFSLLVCSPYFKLIRTYTFSESKRPLCIANYNTIYYYKVELVLKLTFVFVIPFIIIIISYTSLLYAVHKRSTKDLQVTDEDPSQRLAHVFNGRIPKSKMKSIKLTIGIVLSFILCWTAYFTGQFMGTFAGILHPIFYVMTTFYYLNSVANPVLFFIYHQRKPSQSTKSSYSSTFIRKKDNSGIDHPSLGSRLSDLKDVYVECSS